MENNNINIENNNKKFYILNTVCEESAYSVIELTDAEYAVLKKVFKESYNNTVVSESYSGSTILYDKGFDTKEEAIACINYVEHSYLTSVKKVEVPKRLYLMDEKVRERSY